jgi:hypothetical protein
VQPPTTPPAPPTPTPVPVTQGKVLTGGVVLYATTAVPGALKPSIAKSGTTTATAPIVTALTGKIVAPVVKALPKSSVITLSVMIAGKSQSLGKATTSATGVLNLPGIKFTKAGTFTVTMKDSKGVSHYMKIVVQGKTN